MNRKEEIHKKAMSMPFDYPYLCNEEDNNSEYVRKLEDIANWANETILDKASKWIKKNIMNYRNWEYNEFHQCVEYDGSIDIEKMIKDFKKAMKE